MIVVDDDVKDYYGGQIAIEAEQRRTNKEFPIKSSTSSPSFRSLLFSSPKVLLVLEYNSQGMMKE